MAPTRADWIRSTRPRDGVELLRAWFGGRAYDRHRHDTYAICVTDAGVQQFDYRGAPRVSLPGQVVVLHPDEPHDGRAGADDGFGYRIVYLAPAMVADAARALCGTAVPLPFAGDAVGANPLLAQALDDAFVSFPGALEPLAVDALIGDLTRGLLHADPSIGHRRLACDTPAVERARQLLDAERTRIVTSSELEAVSGHDRFALARQFRQLHGTSPYRYLLMRRLDLVRRALRAGHALADVALAAGFADQPHMTRLFTATYGLSPARFRALTGSGRSTRRGSSPARR